MILSSERRALGKVFDAPFTAESGRSICEAIDEKVLGKQVRVTHHGTSISMIGTAYRLTSTCPARFNAATHVLEIPTLGVGIHLKPVVVTAGTLLPLVYIGHDGYILLRSLRVSKEQGNVLVEHVELQPL